MDKYYFLGICGIILSIFIIIISILSVLYCFVDHIKPLQKLYCKIGWHCHEKDYEDYEHNDYAYCKCKWCGHIGRTDNQGNLL